MNVEPALSRMNSRRLDQCTKNRCRIVCGANSDDTVARTLIAQHCMIGDEPPHFVALSSAAINPFEERVFTAPGIFARMRRSPQPELARNAIEARLATTWPNIPTWDEVQRTAAVYNLSDGASLDIRRTLFRLALARFMADGELDPSEQSSLTRLRNTLNIAEDVADAVEREVIAPLYETVVRAQLASVVDENTKARLLGVANRMGVSFPLRDEILKRHISVFIQHEFEQMMETHRVSPEAFVKFSRLAAALGVNPSFDQKTQQTLHTYATLWRIDHGDLPVVELPMQLQPGEVGYIMENATWMEHRRTARAYAYAGVGTSIRIARGIRFRLGVAKPLQIVTDGLTIIDRGVLFMTNRRIVFSGSVRNYSVKIDSLIAFHAFSDGMALEKPTGKHPYFQLTDNAEMACAILSHLMATAEA